MKIVLTAILVMMVSILYCQTIGKVDVKVDGFGEKKFNEAPKKIFVQSFGVNYQMLYDQVEIAHGGREMGGGRRGKAKAQLVLGIQGVSADDLQAMTDQLYAEYKDRLEKKGFQILTGKDVADNAEFEGWELVKGGTPNQAQFPGYVSTSPTGVDFLIRKITNSGKIKGSKGIFDNGQGTSKNLGGIIVSRVNLIVPFVQDGESQGSKALTKSFGGVAKVVAKPNLGIIQSESKEVRGALAAKTISMYSQCLFAYKEGLKKQAILDVKPKKMIAVEGVLEGKKYKAVQSADQDLWGSDYGALTVFSTYDQIKEIVQAVPCDPAKYKKGVSMASSAYVKAGLDEFLGNIK